MAEAAAIIGLLASIASLVDLTTKTVSRLHEYTSKYEEVPESFRSLSVGLPLLTGTLQLIHSQANAGRYPDNKTSVLKAIVDNTSEQISIIQICLSKVLPSDDTSKFERALKALKSLANEDKVQQAVEKIHKNIDLLVFHQTTQHIDTAGCGKSTLISALVDEISCTDDVNNPIAFFYCEFGDERHNTSNAIFRALLRQLSLSRQNKSLHPAILDAYASRVNRGFEPAPLTTPEAIKLLCEVSKDQPTTTIIIDGLDECEDHERGPTIQGLDHLLQTRPQGLKILVSSRDSDDIVRSFQHNLNIAIDKETNAADLAYYIQTEVEESHLLRGQIPLDLKREVIQNLEKDADGMFLWVKLQIKAFKKAKSKNMLRTMIEELPTGLSTMFERLEARVQEQEKSASQLALCALNWSAWAVRPLNPDEFRHALWFGNQHSLFDWSDLTVDLVLDVCQNFLMHDQNLRHISYLTATNFERLAEEQAQNGQPSHIPLYEDIYEVINKDVDETIDKDAMLAKVVDILNHNREAMKPLLVTCPFLHYAGSYWYFHAERGRPELWIDEYTWVWAKGSSKFSQWLNLHDFSGGFILNGMEKELSLVPRPMKSDKLSLVQVSAMLGYANLFQLGLMKHPQDTSTSFIMAAYGNRVSIIKKMLSDQKLRGKIPHLEALLHIKSASCSKAISLILDDLEVTLGPDDATTGWLTIILGSLVPGNFVIAHAAIKRLAQLPSFDFIIHNSLIEAAIINNRQHYGTKLDLKLLEVINSLRKSILGDRYVHWTIFTLMSTTGCKALMQLIIDLDLIDDPPEQLELALAMVTLLGHVEITPKVLQKLDRSSIGDAFCIALSNVSLGPNEKSESILSLLLETLDPASLVSGHLVKSNYPLAIVAKLGHLPSLQNLLDRGASTSVTDEFGRTALHYASEYGHVDVVSELKKKMTPEEILIEDDGGFTAERLAFCEGQTIG